MKKIRWHRSSKEEKIQEQKKKIRALFKEFIDLDPDPPDLYIAIGKVTDPHLCKIALGLFLRRGSVDDIFCLIRKNEKYRSRAWKTLKSKINKNHHCKAILLQIAEDVPEYTIPALEEIKKIGIELNCEDILHLLGLRHVHTGTSLHKELERQHKKLAKKLEKAGGLLESLEKESAKLKQIEQS